MCEGGNKKGKEHARTSEPCTLFYTPKYPLLLLSCVLMQMQTLPGKSKRRERISETSDPLFSSSFFFSLCLVTSTRQ